jgi:hypothetical protein
MKPLMAAEERRDGVTTGSRFDARKMVAVRMILAAGDAVFGTLNWTFTCSSPAPPQSSRYRTDGSEPLSSRYSRLRNSRAEEKRT